MGFGLKTALGIGLAMFAGGAFGGGQAAASAASGKSSGFMISPFMMQGAQALLQSQGLMGQDGRMTGGVFTPATARESRSVKELTRGDPGARAMRLDPVQQRLYGNPVVQRRAQALMSGSRDNQLNSMLRDAGVVTPTTRQGKKTAALEAPSLREIDVQ